MGLLATVLSARAAWADGVEFVDDDATSWDVHADDEHWQEFEDFLASDEGRALLSELDQAGVVGAREPGTRVEIAAELRKIAQQDGRSAARRAELLVRYAGTAPGVREVSLTDPDGEHRSFDLVDEVIEEIAVALHRSVGSIRRELATARRLVDLPATAAALGEGRISSGHAEVIARTSHGLPERVLGLFDRRVAVKAVTSTMGETASFARRLRACLDCAGEDVRRQEAKRHIDVRVWAEDDGLACLLARLPLADASRVHAALQQRARAVPYDADQSAGQRRVAALVATLCGESADSARDAVAVAINVTIGLDTLLGRSDEPGTVDVPQGMPEPFSAGALRELLADPEVPVTLRRLVVDGMTGQVRDRGRRSYRVSDSMREFLIARDTVCRFPGCTRTARASDIDHVTAWSAGGTTDAVNLMPLCRRHHVLKTHGEWSVVARHPDGQVEWRTPAGTLEIDQPWRNTPARIFTMIDLDGRPSARAPARDAGGHDDSTLVCGDDKPPF